MKPTGPKGAGGSGSKEDDRPADEASEDALREAARGLSPAQLIAASRAVVLGDEADELPVELTEDVSEPSAAPVIPPEDRTEEVPGQLLEAAAAAVALDPPRPRPSYGGPPAGQKRPTDPPPHAAYRAVPSSSVIPVPPPFVPFPGAAPAPRATATIRLAVQPPPPSASDATGATDGSGPLVLPTAPPAPTPPPHAAAAPLALPSAPPAPTPPPHAAAAPPALPSAPPAPTPPPHAAAAPLALPSAPPRPSMPTPSAPPGGLPKVIISDEAFRPSQPPPPPAAEAPIPAPAPSMPPRPLMPPRPGPPEPTAADRPSEVPVELTDDAVEDESSAASELVDIPADDVVALAEDSAIPIAAAVESLDAEVPSATASPEGALPAAVVLPAAAAGAGEADDEVTPPDGHVFVSDGITTELPTAAPAEPPAAGPAEEPLPAAPPLPEPPEDLAVDVDAAAPGEPEEVSLSDVQVVRDSVELAVPPEAAAEPAPPDAGGLGEHAPPKLELTKVELADVFAAPTPSAPPPKKKRPADEAEVGFDAPPSVISIPDDDIPRTPAAKDGLDEEGLPVLDAGPAAPDVEAPAKAKAPESADEVAEELGEADVESLEPEESEPSAAPLIAPVRPRASAAPAGARPARARRRRRHGERRPWWEEIFDDEHIRSLPRYSADQTRREVEFIERSLGVARGARVLDLGCGDGRHAVELAVRGFEVVGLDLSLPMLARAGDHAQARAVKLNFIQGDMRDLRFEAAFDAVFCVGTTFGYFDDETNAQVLANAARALKPGGRFLLQVCNRDHVLWNQPRSTWFQGDDRQYLEDTDFNFITSRVTVKRSWATSAGDQETIEYSIRLYSLHEMGKLFHTAGFRVIEISGRFATPGVFFGGDSPSLVLLAEKP
jgi:SAM-dependent methyltransferase